MEYNALPKQPGKSFADMYQLTWLGNQYKEDYSDRLLLAIFWEETCFNNIKQTGKGTAVGFGQIEPSEFWTLQKYGLSLPPTFTEKITFKDKNNKEITIKKVHAKSALSDALSVKATCCILHCMKQTFRTQHGVLGAYAGLEYAKQNPDVKPSFEERLTIIKNWKSCEEQLSGITPYQTYTTAEQDTILKALNTARPFGSLKEQFRQVLFPVKP